VRLGPKLATVTAAVLVALASLEVGARRLA
jgi:hypothetical protein